MQFEPMHRGYGLPVLSGANYTVAGRWHGDVIVEFSDREVAEHFGQDDRLDLKVINGTSCNLSSSDPRNFLSPMGTEGQAETMQLEEITSCMIHGKVAIVQTSDEKPMDEDEPQGRPNGTCQFANPPAISVEWDPWCVVGGIGCNADGINAECRYCGQIPFKNCTNPTSWFTPSTATTTSATTTTATTTTLVDMTIKNIKAGMCLAAASSGIDANGEVHMDTCNT